MSVTLPDPSATGAPAALPALRRVVIVDDSEIDADLLEMRLRTHYPELQAVCWICEPDDIVERIVAFDPDLVITDFHMPRYDLLATIAALRLRCPSVPVLVMSGLVGEERAIQVLKAGASDFLPKSRSERLPMVIDRELSEARAKQAHDLLLAELEIQRRVNAAIVDQVPAGLWLLSPDGVVIRTNPQGEQMMGGFRSLDIEGFDTLQGWWVDSGQALGRHDWPAARAIEHGELVPPRLMRLRTFRSEEKVFSCGAAPLLAEDGSSLGAVVTAMDMTDEVALRERLRLAEEHVRRLSVHQLARHEQQIAGLSRELHDNLGQVLSLLKLHLGSAARAELGSERQSLEIMEALPLVDLALNRLREVCSDLRPSELSDFGLGPALAALCAAAARASSIPVTMQQAGEPRSLDAVLELGLFRVAQQALTNALRHAGAAHVAIELRWLEGRVELHVADDGAGFDADGLLHPHQHGLRGMRERMDLLGGTLAVESRVGMGTTVCACIPGANGSCA